MTELPAQIFREISVHGEDFWVEMTVGSLLLGVAWLGRLAKVRWLPWAVFAAGLEMLLWALLVSPWPWVIGWLIAVGVAIRVVWDYDDEKAVSGEAPYNASLSNIVADGIGIGPGSIDPDAWL